MRKAGKFTNPLVIIVVALLCTVVSAGFKSSPKESSEESIFTCMVNDKPFILENLKATLRNTTGGRKQLSLSNDRFVKFFFINPKVKSFDLAGAEAREAVIRYSEPGTNLIYVPKSGRIAITQLDEATKTVTGTFEMVLVMPGKDKMVKVTKGEFKAPIVILR